MSSILLVEDDQSLGSSLKKYFENEGFKVNHASSLAALEDQEFESDIIVLDWMLPDGQGIDYLRQIRGKGDLTPVIMLTARADLIDKVLGLETGANDYLTKPFEPRELIARVRSQLRFTQFIDVEPVANSEQIILGDLKVDLNQREVYFREDPVELTKMEFDLLKLLAQSPNRAFSREEILNKVWGFDSYPSTRTVDTHILQLRQKLSDELFETIRSVGYRLKYSPEMTKN